MNVWFTVTESVGSGVLGSSTLNVTDSRPVVVWSVTWSELDQLNEPSRIGVSKLNAVTRLSEVEREGVEPAGWQRPGSRVPVGRIGVDVVGEAEPRRPGEVRADRERRPARA